MQGQQRITQHGEVEIEPLLVPDDRLNPYPFRYPDIIEYKYGMWDDKWLAKNVDLSIESREFFMKLKGPTQKAAEGILTFFAIADKIVNDNLTFGAISKIQVFEVNAVLDFQKTMEQEHQIMYGRLLNHFVTDPLRQAELKSDISVYPSVAEKIAWAKKYSQTESLAENIVAFACVEAIYFSVSFAFIFFLGQVYGTNVDNLVEPNRYIRRDERWHWIFGTDLYNKYIRNRLKTEHVNAIVREACENEKSFAREILPEGIENNGLTAGDLCCYAEFMADCVLENLGYAKIYGTTKCPLDYMNISGAPAIDKFFEVTTTLYVTTEVGKRGINTDDEDPEEF